MEQKFKLIKFPEKDRVESCLETVIKSFDDDEQGDYYLLLVLEKLVEYTGNLNTDEYLELSELHIKLNEAFSWYEEFRD